MTTSVAVRDERAEAWATDTRSDVVLLERRRSNRLQTPYAGRRTISPLQETVERADGIDEGYERRRIYLASATLSTRCANLSFARMGTSTLRTARPTKSEDPHIMASLKSLPFPLRNKFQSRENLHILQRTNFTSPGRGYDCEPYISSASILALALPVLHACRRLAVARLLLYMDAACLLIGQWRDIGTRAIPALSSKEHSFSSWAQPAGSVRSGGGLCVPTGIMCQVLETLTITPFIQQKTPGHSCLRRFAESYVHAIDYLPCKFSIAVRINMLLVSSVKIA
jgi:hypothetical protein